jgi:hypothetical protein
MTDFEKGEIEAFHNVFPTTELSACLFHLGQSFFRRFKKLGLQKRFNDLNVRKTFRLTISSAFLPPETVRKAFALIIDNAPVGMEGWHQNIIENFTSLDVLGFLHYISKNYIGLSQWEIEKKEAAFKSLSDRGRMMAEMIGNPGDPQFNSTPNSFSSTSAHHADDAHGTLDYVGNADHSAAVHSLLHSSIIGTSTIPGDNSAADFDVGATDDFSAIEGKIKNNLKTNFSTFSCITS